MEQILLVYTSTGMCKMTTDQERRLRGLLDLAIPECRVVRKFFRELREYGIDVAMNRFESHGIKNDIYWRYAKELISDIYRIPNRRAPN